MIRIRQFWALVRELADDDAYERYLRHHREAHSDAPPLDRRAFWLERQRQKWSGVQRCC